MEEYNGYGAFLKELETRTKMIQDQGQKINIAANMWFNLSASDRAMFTEIAMKETGIINDLSLKGMDRMNGDEPYI